MTVIVFLTDPLVVRRVLEHLKIPATPPPIWPARSDPRSSWPPHEEPADEIWPDQPIQMAAQEPARNSVFGIEIAAGATKVAPVTEARHADGSFQV
jgi:hypothetical protein